MTTEEQCLTALQDAAEILGNSPTKAEYEELGVMPASATVMRVMGGWNAAKEAAGLETSYSRGARVGSKPEHIDCTDREWRNMSVDQRWHYRNVERNTQRTLDRRDRLRAWVFEIKREGSCVRCGESNPACLDFHHVNEESKRMSIGKMVSNGFGKDELELEIEKCELLCANCHRKEHFEYPKILRAELGHGDDVL